MIIEIDEETKQLNLNSAQVAYEALKKVFGQLDEVDQDKEHMFVLGLKRNNRIKYLDLVSVGTLTGTVVGVREIYRRAIHYGVHSIFISHNHPSGTATPSSSDIAITKKLKEAGILLGIELVDHVIYTNEGYYSFANEGTL